MNYRAFVLCCAVLLSWALPVVAAVAVQQAALPQSLDFLPPPPAESSADFTRDKEIYLQTRQLKGSERWKQATFDAADRLGQNGGALFVDSFGLAISKKETPATYALLELLYTSLAQASKSGKEHYKRVRPYRYYKADGETCAPVDEARLSNNGSYPSGHTARGWGMALLLAEISPERQAAVLKRGYEIGWSRVVCGFHWASDVDAARMVAAAVVANVHTNPEFIKLLEASKQEIAKLRATGK